MADHNGRDFAGTKWAPCPGCPKCEPNGGLVLRRGKWRPTNGHEYLFVFSKGGDYFCDSEAVAELATGGTPGNKTHKGAERYQNGDRLHRRAAGLIEICAAETRNPRSVLSFPSEPFKGKHFATYPSSLPKFFIEAATSKVGCCPTCGACHAPIVASERVPTRPGINNANDESGMANLDPQRHIVRKTVQGYRQTCKCPPAPPVPCLVFDPFMGSGTTARAAKWLGRDWLGCELNPEYAAMAYERIEQPPKWATAQPKRAKRRSQPERLLF